jgi:signal transduction histidine kinase
VIGVLEVINKRNSHFSTYDVEVLSVLASQAAVAIENTRLFQQSDQIAELVHELRTPLSSISTASYLLQQEKMPEEQRVGLAKTIYNETQRLSELASSFLDLARLESGRVSFNPTQFDLLALIEETIQVFNSRAAQLQIRIFTDIKIGLSPINADRDKLKQVFINLITNGLKYNRPGGEIKISAEQGVEKLMIRISDTGIGMHPDTVQHLFEKFYRAKNTEDIVPGTGLGLMICKSIIESHHGEISVDSTFGMGTTFIIILPIKPGN